MQSSEGNNIIQHMSTPRVKLVTTESESDFAKLTMKNTVYANATGMLRILLMVIFIGNHRDA